MTNPYASSSETLRSMVAALPCNPFEHLELNPLDAALHALWIHEPIMMTATQSRTVPVKRQAPIKGSTWKRRPSANTDVIHAMTNLICGAGKGSLAGAKADEIYRALIRLKLLDGNSQANEKTLIKYVTRYCNDNQIALPSGKPPNARLDATDQIVDAYEMGWVRQSQLKLPDN
jgi:hypothetical protein